MFLHFSDKILIICSLSFLLFSFVSFYFFLFVFHLLFVLFLFFLFFSRPSRRPNKQNSRNDTGVKRTIFFCENLTFGSRWIRGGGVALSRVTSLSCFSLFCFVFCLLFTLRKMFLLFQFSCISFIKVSLLASISEFYCFLCSRCSMEMWCLDDIGRDNWDWVGHLRRREHDTISQSGVEAPRLLNGASPDCCCYF